MEDLKIIQKTYDVIEYGYNAIAQFPKSEKYALGNDMKRCMHKILEYEIVGYRLWPTHIKIGKVMGELR